MADAYSFSEEYRVFRSHRILHKAMHNMHKTLRERSVAAVLNCRPSSFMPGCLLTAAAAWLMLGSPLHPHEWQMLPFRFLLWLQLQPLRMRLILTLWF